MNLLSYIFPQTRFQTQSDYHADIRVVDYFGSRSLISNGIPQTSRYHSQLFRDVFARFVYRNYSIPNRVLVLGVGGGFVLHELKKHLPTSRLTGVDIDQTIIDIGREWFDLSSLRELELIALDAFTYLKTQAAKLGRFDIVIVDLFSGNDIPGFVWDDQFVAALSQITSLPGVAVVNFNYDDTHKTPSRILEKALRRHYHYVRQEDIKRNRFFIAKRPKKLL